LKTIIVTLSGTHGTGKSTHAGRTYYLLNHSGHKFSYLRHQDLIDPFGFILRRGARVLGFAQTNQLERMKPVRILWSLYFLFVYCPLLVGGIRIRRALGYSVVADRYLYDLIVAFWGNQTHVPLEHLLVWIIPRPDVSFILDADEERILANRPEHSAEFIRNEKRLYDGVARYFGLEKIRTTTSAATTWKRMLAEIEASLQQASPKNN